MKQAIIYARYSPRPRKHKRQDKGKSKVVMSNETQFQLCRDYCSTHGLDVVDEYQDAGISGKNMQNRPGLSKALVHVCKIRGVLVANTLARLTRGGIRDAIDLADKLRKHHANLALVTQHVDTSTSGGRAWFHMMAVLDEWHREVIAERTSEALRTYQANGRRVSARVLYGFKLDPADPKLIIRDRGEQIAVKQILALHKSGLGYRAIARRLTEAGVPARSGTWRHQLISSIIHRHI